MSCRLTVMNSRIQVMTFDEAIRIQSAMKELLQDKKYGVRPLDILSLVYTRGCSAYD